jgi:hypothetical protein
MVKLRDMLYSNDEAIQLEATKQYRKLLSIERNPPIQEIIDQRVVPRFVEFLSYNHNPVSEICHIICTYLRSRSYQMNQFNN